MLYFTYFIAYFTSHGVKIKGRISRNNPRLRRYFSDYFRLEETKLAEIQHEGFNPSYLLFYVEGKKNLVFFPWLIIFAADIITRHTSLLKEFIY